MARQNEIKLKDALRELIEHFQLKPKLFQNRIGEIWQEKMGVTIWSHTKEIKLRGRILYLAIDSSSLKQELVFSKDKIVTMLNEALGEDFIEEVVIR